MKKGECATLKGQKLAYPTSWSPAATSVLFQLVATKGIRICAFVVSATCCSSQHDIYGLLHARTAEEGNIYFLLIRWWSHIELSMSPSETSPHSCLTFYSQHRTIVLSRVLSLSFEPKGGTLGKSVTFTIRWLIFGFLRIHSNSKQGTLSTIYTSYME